MAGLDRSGTTIVQALGRVIRRDLGSHYHAKAGWDDYCSRLLRALDLWSRRTMHRVAGSNR